MGKYEEFLDNNGAFKSSDYEPIAIVGMGCRFPGGANNPYQFWENLLQGKDCLTETPESRWNSDKFFTKLKDKRAKMNTQWGGYIDGFDEFDPAFFGISPREANYMDPQQRKLLEVAWEAIEEGGLKPSSLSGKAVGVFMGGFTLDYKIMQFTNPDFSNLDAHTATGIMMTMLSNRISYIYNLNGPSMSVDTACSSSVVAIDLACKSLQQNDSEIALAGGVLLNMAPQYTISETRGGFLSPTGSSHAFSATANGYVRSEGAGVVVLKKLVNAIADGDQIHAVVRASAVNQDGRTSGITVPDGDAQLNLMKKAYKRAGVNPGKVQYIETHGTGTPVGDPIEANSVGRLLSLDRDKKDACYIGSVKTNIGHTEAAAGIAGLIKTVMALKNKKIPPHLHLTEINPKIDIDNYPYNIPSEVVDWPNHDGPAIAGVNSFGFGGTNSHLVLSEYIEPEKVTEDSAEISTNCIADENSRDATIKNPINLFSVSSRDKKNLVDQVLSHIPFIEKCDTDTQLDSLSFTSGLLREQHEHKAIFSYESKQDLLDQIQGFVDSKGQASAIIERVKDTDDRKLVWVFTGMGPQWWAMGRELYASDRIFKDAIDKIDEEFSRQTDWSLIGEWIQSDEQQSQMDNTWLAQTANFALQVGLAEMWKARGVTPDAIVGHSTGEIASFYLAGVYSLKDAVTIAIHRSRLQQLTHGMGKMLAVGLPAYQVQSYIQHYRTTSENGSTKEKVSVAAVNSPSAVTLAGDADALEEIAEKLTEKEIFNKFLRAEVPYHSPVMENIKDDLFDCLKDIKPQEATLPLYATVTGEQVTGKELNAEYWWKNVRDSVLFGKAAQEMIDDGYRVFLEIGPHPVLTSSIQEVAAELGKDVSVVSSLRRKSPEERYFSDALARFHGMGFTLNWKAMFPAAKRTRLPTYQWRRDRYWHETAYYNKLRQGQTEHPLVGSRRSDHGSRWYSDLSLEKYPYLDDHRIQDTCLFPAAGYVEMIYGAVQQNWGQGQYSIHNLSIDKGVFFSAESDPQLQLHIDEGDSSFAILSKEFPEALTGQDKDAHDFAKDLLNTQFHTSGYIKRGHQRLAATISIPEVQERIGQHLNQQGCYEQLHHHAYQYGPAFQAIEEIWASKDELLAKVSLPEQLDSSDDSYYFHPSLFDACLQTVIFSEIRRLKDGEELDSRLPVKIGKILIQQGAPKQFWCHTRITHRDNEKMIADILLYDDQNQTIGEIRDFVAKSVDSLSGGVNSNTIDKWLYHPSWQKLELETEQNSQESQENVAQEVAKFSANLAEAASCYLLFSDKKGLSQNLAKELKSLGSKVCIVESTESALDIDCDLNQAKLNSQKLSDIQQLFSAVKAKHSDFQVIHCMGLDSTDIALSEQIDVEEHKRRALHSLLMISKAMVGADSQNKLWVITENAQPIELNKDSHFDVMSSSITGMCRVLAQQELIDNWGRLIDIDSDQSMTQIVNELRSQVDEDEVSFRAGERYVTRLMQAENLQQPFPVRLNENGTYMVVGAFGAIGQLVSKMLVSRGARRLLITSRNALPARESWQHMDSNHRYYDRIQFVRSLESAGAEVILADVDVSRERELRYFFERFGEQGYPDIRGIYFCAGVVKDAIVPNIEISDFDDVYDTKAVGALALHNCSLNLPLEHFVLFSSVASQVTTIGQTNYAAGNSFLDGLCHHRVAKGYPALSINWGPWAIGMIKELNLIDHYKSQRGMSCILPDAGMKVMERILDQDHAQLTVCEGEWSKVVRWYSKTPSMFAHLSEGNEDEASNEGGFLESYLRCDQSQRVELVAEHMQLIIAQVLRCDTEQVDTHTRLVSLGIDSIMGAELSNRITNHFGQGLSVVKLIGDGNIASLAIELNDKVATDSKTLAAAQNMSSGENSASEQSEHQHSETETTGKNIEVAKINPFSDVEIEAEFPLSYGQKAIWFTNQLNPESAAYNIGGAMHIPSELNLDALDKAIKAVVQRHPGLRTNFYVEDGEPVQRVYAHREVSFDIVDVAGKDWPAIKEMVITDNQRPFDLETEALYRIRLYKQSEQSYYFAITIYHIISDAWSNYMFLNEMQELYARYNSGEQFIPEGVSSSYENFVSWENRLINSIRGSSMYKFWRNRLPTEIPQLNLPLDKKRPTVMTNNGNSYTFTIDKDLTAKLKELSRGQGATMFMALMGIYYSLLNKYSQQDDIIIGSPVAGRTSPEFSDIYGYFVNPLPMWQNFAKNPSFVELLKSVKESTLAALDNQEFPFALLVDRLALEHDPSYSAVFQAMFVLLNHQVDRSHMDEDNVAHYKGFPMQLLQMPEEEGQFDITLSVYEENGVYQCTFKYNTDLFFASTIESMAEHYIELARQAVGSPDKPIKSYDMLSKLERTRLVNDFSNADKLSESAEVAFLPVHKKFAQSASEYSEKIAVKHQDGEGNTQEYSYKELSQRANQIAHALIGVGIKPGDIVALYQEKSVDLISSILGCLNAGACYLILEPGQPIERIQSMLSDANAKLVLFDNFDTDQLEHDFSSLGYKTLSLSELNFEQLSTADTGGMVHPVMPAYLVFTSGSTGRPKGVIVSHANISSIAESWQRGYSLSHQDTHLQMANSSFDVFTGDWVRALCHGGRLVLCDKAMLMNIPRLHQNIIEEEISIAEFVPTVMRKLLDYLDSAPASAKSDGLTGMRTLIVGSERWNISDYQRMRAFTSPGARFINSYGTSETAIDTSFFDLSELNESPYLDLSETDAIPIGKPFDNSCVFILNEDKQPVATGVVGEMYIGGHGVALGYTNNLEQTKLRFVEHELTQCFEDRSDIGQRLYRTGDLAKWDLAGNLHLSGRSDTQVKVRGHRIELGEVEKVIAKQDQVSRAVATVCQDHSGQEQLCIYFETVNGVTLSTEELRAAAARELPSYMIPAWFQQLETLPELANGKFNMKALPKPEIDRSEREIVAPKTYYEKEMASIWSAMLGTQSISIYDDFFEMGGNSLYLIELCIQVQKRFNIRINVSQLFKLSTLIGMATVVEDILTGKVQGGMPYLSYNENAPTKMFSFPPAGGYSIVYKTIAESLKEANIISFNYLMEEDKLDRYVQMIEEIQPKGPYQLFGYSLGGNLAFEVAQKLEARGHKVENTIIMDSYRITDTIEIKPEHIEEFREELKGHLLKHTGSDDVQAHTMEQANNYIDFSYSQKNLGVLESPLHYIVEKNETDPNRVHKLASWNEGSKSGVQIYIGVCKHEDMLLGDNAQIHADIIQSILKPQANQIPHKNLLGTQESSQEVVPPENQSVVDKDQDIPALAN